MEPIPTLSNKMLTTVFTQRNSSGVEMVFQPRPGPRTQIAKPFIGPAGDDRRQRSELVSSAPVRGRDFAGVLQNLWDERGEVRERVRQRGIERERESTWRLGAFRWGGALHHRRGGAFCRRTSVVGGWEREKGVLGRSEKETWEGRERGIWIFFWKGWMFSRGFWRVKLYFSLFVSRQRLKRWI